MNSSIEIVSEEKRLRPSNSEVHRLLGSNKKITSLTNWKPAYNNIEGFRKGLKITIEWFTNSQDLSLYKSSYVI